MKGKKRNIYEQRQKNARTAGALLLTGLSAIASALNQTPEIESEQTSAKPSYRLVSQSPLNFGIEFDEGPTYTVNKIVYNLAVSSGLDEKALQTAAEIRDSHRILRAVDTNDDFVLTPGELRYANKNPERIMEVAREIGWPLGE